MKKIKEFLLNLLFPINCLGCGKDGQWLCPVCTAKIKINQVFGGYLSGRDFLFLDGLLVVADYQQPLLQKIIHNYKYLFISDLSRDLSELLCRFLKNYIAAGNSLSFDLIIPIPLSKKRLAWRGFNQAEILALAVSQNFGWPMGPKLVLRKHARPQVGLNAKSRQLNVAGIFKTISPEIIAGKKILLVDDVITTGATLQSCAKALKAAGAKEIFGLVIAKD